MDVVLLSGGTGGAKLARGLLDEVGAGCLTVIANTGDDAWIHGVHVSPDPDLITYWLADLIDDRGYGIRGDTWAVMDALEAGDRPAWFRLGDRDLAMCLVRTEELRAGRPQTAAHAAVSRACGVGVPVLPMCDEPVRAHVTVRGRSLPFQEFMIVERAAGPIDAFELEGIEAARPSAEVLEAIGAADVVVIGPSNPIASIGPILAVPGLRDALLAASAPTIAVSPFLGGAVLKGPTQPFCAFAGIEPDASGLLQAYPSLLDGIVADEQVGAIATLRTETLMDTPRRRREVAANTLEFAASLRS